MGRIIDLYCRILKCTIAVCLAVMVVLVFGNVALRYIFNSGITMSEELSRWLLVWLTFLGAIVALSCLMRAVNDALAQRRQQFVVVAVIIEHACKFQRITHHHGLT